MARQIFPVQKADQRMWLFYGGTTLVISFLLSLVTQH